MKTHFQEEQKFTQWWLWLVLIGVALMPAYGIYKQIILGGVFGDKPMSDSGLIIAAVVSFGLLLLFLFSKLKTTINDKEILINFFSFTNKSIQWQDVKSAELITYSFVGYGIRLFTKYGTVYNTKGNKGLALELKNGKSLLIGTQKMEELKEVVTKVWKL
ncbi:hypothetical protein FFWV33_03575 [Flavobacterium faecale]|uniref:Bacterial Pleckstrin homology domain-containing protein n=1 Tax=Flavobacterium faecale TaxID=1355330 RepID=A0A2S1LA87_9FLAO|nr:hypothetical protein [Flavobacterium faecale]AWG20683.1 hypothetical protein FFWV33_03575 [Flavobacterium faecale]